jgi:MerR family mercuric resistance operon transcriptional regulator
MATSRLTIGKLATCAGVNLETVRYYERIGIMPAPDRTKGGHRDYTGAHVQKLAFIRRARELGFSIEDIRALIELAEPSPRSCGEVRMIAENHLADVDAKISDLVRLQSVLREAVARCGDGATPLCPVIEILGAV